MKDQKDTFGAAIELGMLGWGLRLLVILIGAPLAFGADYLADRYGISLLVVVSRVFAGLTLFAFFFTAGHVAKKMHADPSRALWDAFVDTLFDYVLVMTFIPVVGPLFERLFAERKRNPFTEGAEPGATDNPDDAQ